jgi:hypothetical protein
VGEGEIEEHIDASLPTGAKAAPREARRRQILALGGGGYRGLYSATFLDYVEEGFPGRVAKKFDLLAGTSIGGLIAAALVFEVPAATIAEKMIKHGPLIFPRSFLTPAKQMVFRAPYSAETLKSAVIDTIGKENAALSMKEVEKPLAICAVNYTHGSPKIFRSAGLAEGEATDATVLQAVLASAAAPTYFPPQLVGGETLVDGGIIANAPELLALCEGCGRFGWRLQDTYVLSLGTASRSQGAALGSLGSPSVVSWMVRRKLFQATMAAQEVLAESQCRTLLGERYYRVDREPAQQQVAAIREFDYATKEAKETLQSLASESWNEHQSRAEFRGYFA